MTTPTTTPQNVQTSSIVATSQGARSGAIVFWSGSEIPRANMRHAQIAAGIPSRHVVRETTEAALALRLALDKFSRQDRSLLAPKSLGRGVWSVMRAAVTGADEDALTKGGRAGDMVALTEVKAWIDKTQAHAGPVLMIEGATAAGEQFIRDHYNHTLTVVPSGKFGTAVGSYLRDVCGGVVLKATMAGKTGQGQGGSLYVPESGMPAWAAYCGALAASGSEATLFEIPAMSCEQTAQAIGAALTSEVEYKIGKIEGEIAAATIGDKALKGRQGDLEELRQKLDDYAGMLGGLADGIRKRITDVDSAVAAAICQSIASTEIADLYANTADVGALYATPTEAPTPAAPQADPFAAADIADLYR